MRIFNEDILEVDGIRQTKDMSANFNLHPIYLGHIVDYSIQLVFTGTPGGNFKLQASNDPGRPNATSEAQQVEDIVNWTDVLDSAQTISAAGNHTWTVENAGYLWVRVVWTQTSGSGTLVTARANGKGVQYGKYFYKIAC